MEPLKYLSPEWTQEAHRRLLAELDADKMKHVTSSMLTCRQASRIVDVGHQAVREAIQNGGYQGMTETELFARPGHAAPALARG